MGVNVVAAGGEDVPAEAGYEIVPSSRVKSVIFIPRLNLSRMAKNWFPFLSNSSAISAPTGT